MKKEHAYAKMILKCHKDNTAYFDGTITVGRMYEMHFGNAESQCIIAALTLAGAVWKENNYDRD